MRDPIVKFGPESPSLERLNEKIKMWSQIIGSLSWDEVMKAREEEARKLLLAEQERYLSEDEVPL